MVREEGIHPARGPGEPERPASDGFRTFDGRGGAGGSYLSSLVFLAAQKYVIQGIATTGLKE
jgi:hypothetical protein